LTHVGDGASIDSFRMMNEMDRNYLPQSVLRAAQVLDFLAGAGRPMRLSEISRSLGIAKSSLLGVLSALERLGWLEREGLKGAYRPGRGLLDLSRKAFGEWDLPVLARPLMEQLAERLGESVFLGVLQEDRVVILSCVEGRGQMRVTSRPGTSLPLLAAATGKVLLAAMEPARAMEILRKHPLPGFTERSIRDVGAFMEEVQRAKTMGYALDDEEYLRGIRAAAAPLMRSGEVVGAMWVVGFSSVLPLERLEQAGRELLRTTELLSRLISFQAGG
jgi:DNA-binding IclR family transcriptional regulator